MAKVAVVFDGEHSGTEKAALYVAEGARTQTANVSLINVSSDNILRDLESTDSLIFGVTCNERGISNSFRQFINSTSDVWQKLLWKNKLAAGFTCRDGEHDAAMGSIASFACRHGMLWIAPAVLPFTEERNKNFFECDEQKSLGLSVVSVLGGGYNLLRPLDLLAAKCFGQRVADVTNKFGYKGQCFIL